MGKKLRCRDSKDMLKLLDRKFIDNVRKQDPEKQKKDENEEERIKEDLIESFNRISFTSRNPIHLNQKRQSVREDWKIYRNSITEKILNKSMTPKPVNPELEVLYNGEYNKEKYGFDLKEQRMADEAYGLTLKWDFDRPTIDHIEQLKYQFFRMGFVQESLYALFENNLKSQLRVIKLFKTSDARNLVDLLDLIFRWLTLQFQNTSPLVVYKCIEFMYFLFNTIKSTHYIIQQYEVGSLFPYFFLKLGDPRYLVRKGFRLVLKPLIDISDYITVYNYLIEGLADDKNDFSKIECLEEIGNIFDQYGLKKVDPVTFKEITRLVRDSNPTVVNTCLNLLAYVYCKYGQNDLNYLIQNVKDETDLNLLQKHIKLFNEQSKIFPIKRSVFLIDSYAIMEAIKSMSDYLSNELKYEQENWKENDHDRVDELLKDILDKSKDLSMASLHEIKWSMRDVNKKKYIVEHVDQITMTCSVKLFDSINEYKMANGKNCEHLLELINLIIRILSDIFYSGIGKNVYTDPLTYSMSLLLKILNDENFINEQIKEDLTTLLNFILKKSNQTTCFCSLVRILRNNYENDYYDTKLIENVVEIIWEKFKQMQEKSDNEDITKLVDILEVLYEIHLFLEKFPTNTWYNRSNDLPLRAVNTIIYEITKVRRSLLVDDLLYINIPSNAEIIDFIYSILEWIRNNQENKF